MQHRLEGVETAVQHMEKSLQIMMAKVGTAPIANTCPIVNPFHCLLLSLPSTVIASTVIAFPLTWGGADLLFICQMKLAAGGAVQRRGGAIVIPMAGR